MWDTIQKLEYRARAGIADAEENLNRRLNDRVLLPLKGIHGEALYLTGMRKLSEKAMRSPPICSMRCYLTVHAKGMNSSPYFSMA